MKTRVCNCRCGCKRRFKLNSSNREDEKCFTCMTGLKSAIMFRHTAREHFGAHWDITGMLEGL